MYEIVGVEIPAGVALLCYVSSDQARVAGLMRACGGCQTAVAAQLVQLADDLGISDAGIAPSEA